MVGAPPRHHRHLPLCHLCQGALKRGQGLSRQLLCVCVYVCVCVCVCVCFDCFAASSPPPLCCPLAGARTRCSGVGPSCLFSVLQTGAARLAAEHEKKCRALTTLQQERAAQWHAVKVSVRDDGACWGWGWDQRKGKERV